MINTLLSPELVARLPTPKGVALALTKACRRDDVHLHTIADLVRTDPALSGRLLAVANSAASGGRIVFSVDEAVCRMGFTVVSQIALAFSLIDQHSSGFCSNFNYAGFWNQSLLMAAASKEFGTPLKLGSAGELFTVGLFAQVGRLALATAYPQEYANLVVADANRSELLQQERVVLGIDHLQLSVALMEHWGVPPEYARPFGIHEDSSHTEFSVDSKLNGRAQLAHAAWRVAFALSNEGVDSVFDCQECVESLAWLQLSSESLMEQLKEIEAVWQMWLTLISRQN